MLYVGLDIHDKRIAICVLGETGQIDLWEISQSSRSSLDRGFLMKVRPTRARPLQGQA
jgi:hypothetical protein